MKEILKKNIVLIVALTVALLISCVLLSFVFITISQGKVADKKVNDLKSEIQDLSSKKPAPIDENLKNIKSDIEQIKQKTYELQKIFGNPYRKAFKQFLIPLQIDEQNFLTEWKKYQQKNDKKSINIAQTFEDFLNTFPVDKINLALTAFIKTLNEDFLVKVKSSIDSGPDDFLTINAIDYLLEYLGYSRRVTPEDCVDYVAKVQKAILSFLELNHLNSTFGQKKSFLFSELDRVPSQDLTPYIMKHCRFFDDFFKRLALSKVNSIELLQKKNGIEGEKFDNYLILKYEVNFTGSLVSIRDFLNSLQKAALEDYRVYVVKTLTFNKLFIEINAQQPTDKSKPTSSSSGIDTITQHLNDKSKSFSPSAIKNKEDIASGKTKEIQFDEKIISSFIKNLRPKGVTQEDKSDSDLSVIAKQIILRGHDIDLNNGNIILNDSDIVLGASSDSNIVKCLMEFDYIIYVGDEIKSK